MRSVYPPAVVFDNDGVLVDSEPLINDVLARILTDIGLPMSPREVEARFLGGTIDAVLHWVEKEASLAVPADFDNMYHRQLMDGIDGRLRPVPGVRGVVESLIKEGVRVAVASNSGRQWVLRALEVTGLEEVISPDRVVTVDDVEHGKPAPDVYLGAAARLALPATSCVAVDDSGPGIESARAAGMATIGFAGRTHTDRLGKADLTITAMDELLAAIAEAWMQKSGAEHDDRRDEPTVSGVPRPLRSSEPPTY